MKKQGCITKGAIDDPDFYTDSEEEFEIDFDEYVAAQGLTELHVAIMEQEILKAKHLIRSGEDVNTPNKQKQTPIFSACSDRKRGLDLVKDLFENGADINVIDNNGQSPLHMAVMANNYKNVKYLLEQGADILIRDNFNNDALSLAAICDVSPKLLTLIIESTTLQLQERMATIANQPYRKILLAYLSMIHNHYHKSPQEYSTLISEFRLVINDVPTHIEQHDFDTATKKTNQFYQTSSSILENKKHLQILGIVAITLLCITLGCLLGFTISSSALASSTVLNAMPSVTVAGFSAAQIGFELLMGAVFATAAYVISHSCFFATEKKASSIHQHALDEIKQSKDALRYR